MFVRQAPTSSIDGGSGRCLPTILGMLALIACAHTAAAAAPPAVAQWRPRTSPQNISEYLRISRNISPQLACCGSTWHHPRPTNAAIHVVVDPDRGDDSNDGHSDFAPLRSLHAAKIAVQKALVQPGVCGVTVILAAGKHRLSKGGLHLAGQAESGHGPGCEVIWTGVDASRKGGGGAVISGGIVVPGTWTLDDPVRDVWSTMLPPPPVAHEGSVGGGPAWFVPGPRQLYVNGRRAHRARSPVNVTLTHKHGMNGQWIPGCLINSSDPAGCNFTMTRVGFVLRTVAPLPSAVYCSSNVSLCELEMAWTGRSDAWNAPRCPVRGIHSTHLPAGEAGGSPLVRHVTEFIMAQPCWENGAYKKGHVGSIRELPVFLENSVALVRNPGDFATSGGRVYFKPWQHGKPPAAGTVEIPGELHLLTLNRTADHVFEALTFEMGGWLGPSSDDGFIDVQAAHRLFGNATFAKHCQLPLAPGLPDGQGGPPCAAPMPAHIWVRSSSRVLFNHVTFRNMGAVALNISDGSQDITVRSCDFEHISGGALSLGQADDWSETDSTRQNARLHVIDCSLTNITQEFGGAVGIFVGFVRDSIITQTTIDSPAKACISLGWGWGSASPSYMRNNTLTRNLCLRGNSACCGGMGVIYTLGSQPGTTIAYNYVRDAARVWAGVGFHHDEGSEGITDQANVVFNAPGLEKIHITYGLLQNGSSTTAPLAHNYSDPLTRDIRIMGCWTNSRPVPDQDSGQPGQILVKNNQYINTTNGEQWPAAAVSVMSAAGIQRAMASVGMVAEPV